MRRIASLFCLLAVLASPVWAEPMGGRGVYDVPATALRDAPALETYAGQPALVILFQPHCPWCLKQFREAEAFVATRPGVRVIAVSLQGSRADLIAELRAARTDFPAYRSSPVLLERLGAPEGAPRTYTLSADGTVTAAARGLQDRRALEKLLVAINRGAELTVQH